MRGEPHLLGVDHRRADPVNEISKTQAIRLADVFFIGPVMIVGGLKLTGVLGKTLVVLGVATILYNAKNYRQQERV